MEPHALDETHALLVGELPPALRLDAARFEALWALPPPYATNKAWTHEVPHHASSRGRRISVTLRAFEA